MFSVKQSDAIVFLEGLEDRSIDLVITDPAYESLEKHRAKGTTTRLKNSKSSSNNWFEIFPNNRFEKLFIEIYRVLKTNTHFYMFCDSETMFHVKPIAEKAGFKFWKPLIWDKVNIGMGYHYRSRCEFILFFEKGERSLSVPTIDDVIRFKRIYRGYPTEKPAKLSGILIEQSSDREQIVCDPFMGSGSVGVAALLSNRQFIGCDLSPKSLEIASDRLRLHSSKTNFNQDVRL